MDNESLFFFSVSVKCNCFPSLGRQWLVWKFKKALRRDSFFLKVGNLPRFAEQCGCVCAFTMTYQEVRGFVCFLLTGWL